MMSAQMLASTMATSETDQPGSGAPEDQMKLLEAQMSTSATSKPPSGSSVSFVRGETQSEAVEAAGREAAANPDEIDIDDDDDDDDDDGDEDRAVGGVEKQAIPSQVFGGLKKDDDDDD